MARRSSGISHLVSGISANVKHVSEKDKEKKSLGKEK